MSENKKNLSLMPKIEKKHGGHSLGSSFLSNDELVNGCTLVVVATMLVLDWLFHDLQQT